MICNRCGQEIPDHAKICDHCGAEIMAARPAVEIQKPENVVTGTVGALLGAAIGAVVIILLGRMGMVAAASGIVLAVCTLKGYELLGGRLTKKGIAISVLLMLAVPYVADRIDWAFIIMEQAQSEGLDWTFGECFQVIPQLIEEEIIEKDVYITNLVELYAFTGLGVVASLFGNKKQKKSK